MTTDLFVAVAGVNPSTVAEAIPPACFGHVDVARVTISGEVAVLESPTWVPRSGARHLVPSFSLLGSPSCSFRFELSALTAGAWTLWVPTTTIGAGVFGEDGAASDALVPAIDMYTAPRPVERARLRVRLHPAGALTENWIMALSTSDVASPPVEPETDRAARLEVPARSQMEEAAAIRERICSPTCVAMVLEFWGRAVSVPQLAAEVFHAGLDLYGVWPAAIHAAARRGVAGYLLRFPDWASAAWCLEQGLPIIASIRFEPGELRGAPLAGTAGHLVVIVGAEGDLVLVNDPAGPSRWQVPRRYLLREFCRVWLERGGVGYVLFEPDRKRARPR